MRRYGCWAGNPKGDKENKEYCIAQVSGDYTCYQCLRKRGHGKNGEFCKQHAKMIAEGRNLFVPVEEAKHESKKENG